MAKVTIEDVANKANVSIKTVSRVLNKELNVRQQTRDKVLKAIDALNYQPDPSARRLAGSRSYLIGMLYGIPNSTYITDIQDGALKACKPENYELLIHPCDYLSPKLIPEVIAFIDRSRLDGLLLTPPLCDTEALLQALHDKGVPFVSISPGNGTYASGAVQTNDREVCAEMTSYLASLGHEKIGFIRGHPDHKAVKNRFLGYKEGLEQSGLDFDEKLVAQGYSSFESGMECAILLLRQPNRPTAIFASNDDMAAGVLRVAHQLGLRIPEDLSVVGFDDLSLAKQLSPALTTVRQPIRAMAEKASQLLLGILRGEPCDEKPIIRCRPQLRESTMRIKDGSPD